MAKNIDKKSAVNLIASRVAQEFKDGDVVNLGIGLPTFAANYIPEDVHVIMQTENGMTNFSGSPQDPKDRDPNLIDAGGGFITELPGCCYFDTLTSFDIIRGGWLNVTVLGALQVDQVGNIANWIIPGVMVPGMGGAMDLCVGANKVIATLQHLDKKGNSKILKKCTLPLTAKNVLQLIVTEMAVMEVTPEGLILKEVAAWTNVQEVVASTQADLILPKNIKVFGEGVV